jgi:hypothetical protein
MAVQLQTRLAALGCWLAALAAFGCGADEERGGAALPRAAVAELDKQLGSIERRFAFGDGACADIERDNRRAVRRTLGRLPDTVDPDVRQALRQSFARLFELARRQCADRKPPPTTAAPTPPTTTATAPPPLPPPVTTDTRTATTNTGATTTTPTDTGATTTTPTDTAETTPPPTADRPGSRPNKPTETERGQPSQPNSGGSPAPKQPARRNPPSG